MHLEIPKPQVIQTEHRTEINFQLLVDQLFDTEVRIITKTHVFIFFQDYTSASVGGGTFSSRHKVKERLADCLSLLAKVFGSNLTLPGIFGLSSKEKEEGKRLPQDIHVPDVLGPKLFSEWYKFD